VKILSVTQVARHFREVIDSVERQQEEIVLVRNRKQVARLVPEAAPQDALEVFGDLYRPQVRKSRSAR
jgi:antitoxin (DNA-binding transcriptional repressor) of toxin-antitoxin stability system